MKTVPNVWVVDDHDGDLFLTSRYIQSTRRYGALQASVDGEEALRLLRSIRQQGPQRPPPAPDILFVDVNMPRMSGFELIAELEKAPHLVGHAAVFIVTSIEVPEDRVRAAKSPIVCEYLMKPLDPDTLHRIADNYGNRQSGVVLYDVECTFTDPEVADKWVAWMHDAHIADVVHAGALCGQVVVRESDAIVREVRYRFANRIAFDTYVRDHAPRLRTEGLERFPLSLGLSYQRRISVTREM